MSPPGLEVTAVAPADLLRPARDIWAEVNRAYWFIVRPLVEEAERELALERAREQLG